MLARDIANLSAIRPGHARHRGSFAVLLAGASLSLLASPALAQTQAAATDGAATAASGGLADIVVTAEKREVTIQSAPIAITAVSGDLLKQRNVNELNDISGYVPGLNIAKSGGAERIITIRGIGYETAQNPNTQPGVAFHIDGVYIAHVAALAQDLLDVDRLEVLRGPQGTVFGVTSTGGAINVITKKPVIGEESGTASLSYGSYNYLKANAAVNIPIADTLAMRAAIQYFRRDGYGYSIAVPGRSKYYLDDADNFGGRLALLWQPSSTFSALLEGQIFRADHAGPLQKNILDTTPGARVVAQDFPGKYKIDTSMVYLTLRQELGDFATAKSITAYQYLDKNQSMDIDLAGREQNLHPGTLAVFADGRQVRMDVRRLLSAPARAAEGAGDDQSVSCPVRAARRDRGEIPVRRAVPAYVDRRLWSGDGAPDRHAEPHRGSALQLGQDFGATLSALHRGAAAVGDQLRADRQGGRRI